MPRYQLWPTLVGMPVNEAVGIIHCEDPDLEVIPIAEGFEVTDDIRYDRVRVFFDHNFRVSSIPRLG
ncbi:unnamed protein product [Rotaria sordida]|uniref:Uncharacterized protein n=1 Tax=Rotaria sordida TaxID=392033 RepID=A0A814S8V6_9BILA|nr:unnamed protein product [Rotaria sordida]CAF1142886.1 unnamed protein product [Rotaria sordida]CAF1375569.1 unnamed protein product [Rotaria sordida]